MVHFRLHKANDHCERRSRVIVRKVPCVTGRWRHRGKCNRHSCWRHDVHFQRFLRHCRCHVARRMVKSKCCCPQNTHKTTRCFHDGRTLVTAWSEFHLWGGRCVTVRRRSSRRVRCSRRAPHISVGPCHGTMRKVVEIWFRVRHCRCVGLRRVHVVRCGCAKTVQLHKGKCKGQFAKDVWSGLRFVRKHGSGKCVRAVIRTRRRRCACPASTTRRHCLHHSVVETLQVNYRLSTKTHSCLRLLARRRQALQGCTTQPRLVRVWHHGGCNLHSGARRTEKRRYAVARGCRCLTFVRSRTHLCDCSKLLKTIHRRFCHGHRRWVHLTLRPVRSGYGCARRPAHRERRVECAGSRVSRTPCDQLTGKLTITVWKRSAHHCLCRWFRVKQQIVRCRCPPPIRSKRCVGGKQWAIITVLHRLIKGRCVRRRTVRSVGVGCRTGHFVHRSKCSAVTGTRLITRVLRRVAACRCSEQVKRRKCACRCPPSYRVRRCLHRRGVVLHVHVAHWLRACRCETRRSERRFPVRCPPPRLTRSRCVRRGKAHDGYQQLQFVTYVRDGCRCVRKVVRHQRLCSCARRLMVQKKCLGDQTVVVLGSERVLHHKACLRRRSTIRRTRVVCGPRTRRIVCNKATGVERVTLTWPVVKSCRCLRRVNVVKRRCKCDGRVHRVRVLKCNRHCRQKTVFRVLVLKSHRCVPQFFAKERVCCCPKHRRLSRRCRARAGIHETEVVTLQLLHGRCRPAAHVLRRRIHCPSKVSRTARKQKNGILVVTKSWLQRVGCHCVKRVRRHVRRWKCPPPRSSSGCVAGGLERRVISHALLGGACVRRLQIHRARVLCPPRRRSVGQCLRVRSRHGSFKMVIVEWYEKRGCRCHRRRTSKLRLCRCDPSRRHTRCSRKKVLLLRITDAFRPAHDGRCCVRVRTVRRHPVLCLSHWRHVATTRCSASTGHRLFVFERHIRRGCKCVVQRRRSPCRCACPRPRQWTRCRRDNVLETIRVWHRLRNCRCEMRKRRLARPVRCPKSQIFRSRCRQHHDCVRQIKQVRFVLRACRCYRQVLRRLKKCCCPRPTSSVRCDSLKSRLVHETVHNRLVAGRCERRVRRVLHRIMCSGRRRTIRSGKCINGRKKVGVEWTTRVGCKCVRRRATRVVTCACPKGAVKDMGCRKGCVRTVIVTRYKRAAGGHCYPYRRTFHRLCCCPHKGQAFHVCRKGRLVRVGVSWKFDPRYHACVRRVRKADVTHTIRCSPRYQQTKSKCRKDGSITFVRVYRHLSHCRCLVRKRTMLRRCRCPRSRSRTRCVGHATLETWTVHYFLRQYQCGWRVTVRRRAVLCPRSRHIVHHCNRFTCRKTITSVHYAVRRCRCVRTVRRRSQVCCCQKQRTLRFTHCKSHATKVFEKRWKDFDSLRKVCVSRRRQVMSRIICPKTPRVHTGPCAVRRHKTLYRTVRKHWWRAVECRCRRFFRTALQPCGCVKGHRRTVCRHGIVFSHIVRHVLTKAGVCRRRHVRIGHRRIVCRTAPRRSPGPCSIRGSHGHRYRLVLVTSRRRVGCSCVRKDVTVKELCACRGPSVRRLCVRGGRLHVLVRRHFVRVGGRCRAREVRVRRPVRCPRPRRVAGKCLHGKRLVSVKVFRHTAGCACSTQLLRRKEPCGHCPAGRVAFVVRHGACVSTRILRRRHLHLATLHRTTYWQCRHKCELWGRCGSFNFYLTKSAGTCVLSKSSSGHAGGHGSAKCIHSGKVCRQKCKGVHVRPLGPCRCLSHIAAKPSHCVQKSLVEFYRPGPRGLCKRRVWRGLTPCAGRQCDDVDKARVCVVQRHKGQCRNGAVFQRCRRTCGSCRCHGFHRARTECGKNGQRRVFAVRYHRHPGHGRCVAQYRSWSERCAYCVGGRRTVVRPCRKGRRVIELVQAKRRADGSCALHRTRHVVSCAACNIPDRRLIGPCRVGDHGKKTRRIEVIYFVRRKSCCRPQRSVRVVGCAGCPNKVVKTSRCVASVRVRQIIYFVRHKRFCFRHVWRRSERCLASNFGCQDEMGRKACAEMKQKGLCALPEERKLCKQTCGYC